VIRRHIWNNMNASVAIMFAGFVLVAGAALVVIACAAINGDFCGPLPCSGFRPGLPVPREPAKGMNASLAKAPDTTYNITTTGCASLARTSKNQNTFTAFE